MKRGDANTNPRPTGKLKEQKAALARIWLGHTIQMQIRDMIDHQGGMLARGEGSCSELMVVGVS